MIARTALGWALLFILAAAPLSPQEAAPADLQKEIDGKFLEWDKPHLPCGMAVVVFEGRVVYRRGFGLASVEFGVANTPRTVFSAGALAGPAAALAAVMLAEQGRLSLDESVRATIAELPAYAQAITIRHLLTGGDGLFDWWPLMQLSGVSTEEAITNGEIMRLVTGLPRGQSAPGQASRYSPTGMFLLAEILRRKTGRPLGEWMWENVFRPMKMHGVSLQERQREVVENRANAYLRDAKDGFLRAPDTLAGVGASALLMSADDAGRWLLNLESGEVGGPMLDRTLAADAGAKGEAAAYGYILRSYRGQRLLTQRHSWNGFSSEMVYVPAKRLGVFVASNYDYIPADYFVWQVIDLFLPAPAAPRPPKPPDASKVKPKPALLDSLAGDYRLEGRIWSFARDGGRFILRVSGQSFDLTPAGGARFLFPQAGYAFLFHRDASGVYSGLTVSSDGSEPIVGKRIQLVNPNAAELQEYSGSYFNAESGGRFTIALEREALVLRQPRMRDVRLRPEARDCFLGTLPFARLLVFSRDENNRPSAFFFDAPAVRDFLFKKE